MQKRKKQWSIIDEVAVKNAQNRLQKHTIWQLKRIWSEIFGTFIESNYTSIAICSLLIKK